MRSFQFTTGFERDRYRRITFTTGCERFPIRGLDEDARTVKRNNKFPIFFNIPDEFKYAEKKHLIIFVNGFNEKNKQQLFYYSKEASLATHLENLNSKLIAGLQTGKIPLSISCGLLPVPFHHWRRPNPNAYKFMRETSRPYVFDNELLINEQPLRLYLGFRQMLYDLRKIVLSIKTLEETSIFPSYFDKDVKIHLIGYSMGGLATLSYLLLDRYLEEHHIDSCHLLLSGLGLKYIHAGEFKGFPILDINVLKRVQAFYKDLGPNWRNTVREFDSRKFDFDETIETLFDYLVLNSDSVSGQTFNEIKEIWKRDSRSIQYYAGENDNVMLLEDFRKFIPNWHEGRDANAHLLKNVSHLLFWDKHWTRSECKSFIQNVSTFLN